MSGRGGGAGGGIDKFGGGPVAGAAAEIRNYCGGNAVWPTSDDLFKLPRVRCPAEAIANCVLWHVYAPSSTSSHNLKPWIRKWKAFMIQF